MLVGSRGEVIITNDGVTILEKMDVTHPAARLLIQVARSQQDRVGDGTTTATVLAGALVAEGVAQVTRGVPVAKVVRGVQEGIAFALRSLARRSRPISGLDDPLLYRIAYIAGREYADLAGLVIEGAKRLGLQKLREEHFRFSDVILSRGKAEGEVWPGLLIQKKPANAQLEFPPDTAHILLFQDAFEPETVDEEALTTDAGFHKQLQLREQFREMLGKLIELRVGFIASERGIDPEAEQFCTDHGIMVLQRLPRAELRRIAEYTGARPLRRSGLRKPAHELAGYLGYAGHVAYDERLELVRMAEAKAVRKYRSSSAPAQAKSSENGFALPVTRLPACRPRCGEDACPAAGLPRWPLRMSSNGTERRCRGWKASASRPLCRRCVSRWRKLL